MELMPRQLRKYVLAPWFVAAFINCDIQYQPNYILYIGF